MKMFTDEEIQYLSAAIKAQCYYWDEFDCELVPSKELLVKIGVDFRHRIYEKYRTNEQIQIMAQEKIAAEQKSKEQERLMFEKYQTSDWRTQAYIDQTIQKISESQKSLK